MVRDNLNLVGDEDIELTIETTFDVVFSDDELVQMANVGDLYDGLVARVPAGPGKCETSMVFYRLRRALIRMGAFQPIRPDSSLPERFNERPMACLAELSTLSGLRLPLSVIGPLGLAGCLLGAAACLFFGAAVVLKLPGFGLAAVAAVGLALVCGKADRGRLPKEMKTVGDLVRLTAPQNYGTLVAQGARSSDDLAWTVLTELLGDAADIPPAEIGRDTRFYAQRKAAA